MPRRAAALLATIQPTSVVFPSDLGLQGGMMLFIGRIFIRALVILTISAFMIVVLGLMIEVLIGLVPNNTLEALLIIIVTVSGSLILPSMIRRSRSQRQ
jgi:hypothetical protein